MLIVRLWRIGRSMLVVRLRRIRCSLVSFVDQTGRPPEAGKPPVASGPPVAEHLKPKASFSCTMLLDKKPKQLKAPIWSITNAFQT